MKTLFVPLLGLRLLRGQRRTGLLRVGLIAVGTALGVVLLLVALSVTPVLHARDARLAARTPVCAQHDLCTIGSEVRGSYEGHDYTEVLIDVTSNPPPAGLSRMPRPGELFLSPALKALADRQGNELLRQRLPGRVVGTIASPGLLQPDELYAYAGVSALPDPGAPVRPTKVLGYGGSAQGYSVATDARTGVEDQTPQGRLDPRKVTVDVAAIVLLVPVLLFLATCARLSARTRDRRLAALRLVGMTPTQTRLVNAVETGVAAAAGTLLGLLWFDLLRGPSSHVRLDGRGWFASDAMPTTGHLIALLVGIPVLAVVVGTLAVRNVTGVLDSSRSEVTPRRLTLWRLVPLVLGGALLTAADLTKPKDNVAAGVIGLGLLFTLVGLSLATPLLAQLAAAGLARVTGSLPVLLGTRRIQTEAAGVSRVVTGLVLLVFAGGFAQNILVAVRSNVVDNAAQFGVSLRSNVVTAPARDYNDHAVAASTWSRLPGVQALLVLRHLDAPPQTTTDASGAVAVESQVSALAISCADLAALLVSPPVGCREGVAFRVTDNTDEYQSPVPTGPLRLVDGGALQQATDPATGTLRHPLPSVTVPVPTQTLLVPGAQSFSNTLQAQIVLPPDDPALDELPQGPPDSYYLLTDGSAHTVEELRTAAARIDPRLGVSTAAELTASDSDVDGYHFPLYATLITWGTAVALLVAFASVAVATIDRATERRRHVAMQTAIGVPAATVRRAQLVQVMIPYGVGIACATGLSVLAGLSYAHLTEPSLAATVPAKPIIVTMLVALGGALVVALSVLPSLGRPLTSDLLRQE